MQSLAKEVKQELTGRIVPFWEGLRDEEYGGFYGYQDFDLNVQKTYEKGCILNSRILWFFSNAYLTLKDEKLRADAEHAYRFMKQACVDREYGGVFWSVTYDGKPLDTTKHTYNQAFAIYALSTYFDATGDTEALELAKSLQQIIETHCTDEYGYLEAFTRDFKPESNEKLSENGVMAEKTMNTLLHVFEAYTELYRVTKDPFTGDRLRFMMDLFADKVYNKEKGRQEVFFDRTWNTLIDLYSYGHDIETSWLIDRGTEVLGDPAYREKLLPITGEIAENIYNTAYKNHSLMNECERGVDAEFCVATCGLPRPATLALVRAAAEAGHTVALMSPYDGCERQALCGQIIAGHASTTVDNRGYLLIFNNHLPKQHFRI